MREHPGQDENGATISKDFEPHVHDCTPHKPDDPKEPIECRNHLETGALFAFITSAPLLRSLRLSFTRDISDAPPDLSHIVGSFT